MAKRGRPVIEFNRKAFVDLVALGCSQEEICWFFRDDTGKVANVDTLSRWCKREFGLNYQEYSKKNGRMGMKIQLRRNQIELSRHSAAMAIFLGKNYLGQTDANPMEADSEALKKLDTILAEIGRSAAAIEKDALDRETE